MKWFLIPARPENIDRSIRKPVALAEVRQFLGEKESTRLAALGGGEIRCWAMTSGSKVQFDKMEPGDQVLISERGTGRFNYLAEVTAKITNKALGDYLWPVKPRASAASGEEKSWEFIYFLGNLRSIHADKSALLVLLGYQANDAVAGSRQLDSQKLASFEARNGSLLDWLHTNAKLVRTTPPLPRAKVKAPPEPTATLLLEATVGNDYIPVLTSSTLNAREQTFTYNTEEVERGIKGHVDTQNALASFLRQRGLVPRSPATNEPNFDLAWMADDVVYVAEVKSTTESNEEHQLRLGLGQVLRYRHRFARAGRRVVAVLVPERKPSDREWLDLCRSLGVLLAWPGEFERVITPRTDGGEAPQ